MSLVFHFLVRRAVAYLRWAVVALGGALPLPMENIDPPTGDVTAPNVGVAAAAGAPPKGVPNGDGAAPNAGLAGPAAAPNGLAMGGEVAPPNWNAVGGCAVAAWPKLNP
jgi:hypothetical protein